MPPSTPPTRAPPPQCDDSRWKARIRRATDLAAAGHYRRAAQTLTRSEIPHPTPESCEALHAKHPVDSSAIPPCPPHAPSVIVDPELILQILTRAANGRKGGPSGWTAELMLALWPDPACSSALTLLIQLICNDQLDPHSRRLLTSSILLGLAKPNRDVRPLAIGEEFLRTASVLSGSRLTSQPSSSQCSSAAHRPDVSA